MGVESEDRSCEEGSDCRQVLGWMVDIKRCDLDITTLYSNEFHSLTFN